MASSSRRLQRLSLGPLTVGYSEELGSSWPKIDFIVEGQRFPVHKKILCRISSVFAAMFEGDFKQETVITVEGIRPHFFKLFLKIVYGGTRSITALMTSRECLEVMLIANKYLISGLEDFLRTKLLRSIIHTNVFHVLSICDLNLSVACIRGKCWSVIERQISQILLSEAFLGISWDLLCDILENGRLSIKEYALFEGTLRWARSQRKTKVGAQTLKECLGIAVYKIRFPLMTKREFEVVKRSGVLNSGEILDLENDFRTNTTFPNRTRRNVCSCRKLGNHCTLCIQRSATSVKGIPKNFVFHKTFEDPIEPRTPGPSRKVDVNHNFTTIQRQTTVAPTCECFKYRSCPAFPNGATATILKRIGY